MMNEWTFASICAATVGLILVVDILTSRPIKIIYYNVYQFTEGDQQ